MIPGRTRDPDELRAGLEPWFIARHPDRVRLRIDAITRPAVGLSNETLVVDLGWRGGAEQVVVRLAPLVGIFPEYSLTRQAAVMEVAGGAGVPVPEGVAVETDQALIGCDFLVMPFVAGHIPAEVAALDPWLRERTDAERRTLHATFLAELARLHRIDPAATPLPGREPALVRDLGAELDYWDHYLRWVFGDAVLPDLAAGLAWCRAHQPRSEPAPTLLWGDVRLGNVVFGNDLSVRALLDWEMASIGPAELDLAWYLTLERVVEHFLPERPGGFLGHDEAVAHYESCLGRDVRDLAWHEVFVLVRSCAIHSRAMLVAAEAQQGSVDAVKANPVLGLLRERLA